MIRIINNILDLINISKYRIVLEITYKDGLFLSQRYKFSKIYIINPDYKD